MTGANLKKGARTSIYLPASSDVEGTTGKYLGDMDERNSASFTYDTELQ